MTTISSNLSTLLMQSVPSSSANSSSGALGTSLLSAVEQALAGSGNAGNGLQDIVSLGNSLQTNQAPTYNAQGLLSQMQSALYANDPLLQSGSSGLFGASSGNTASDPASLLQTLMAGQATPSGSAAASTGAPLNTALAQALQQNPSLASELVQASTDQGILGFM